MRSDHDVPDAARPVPDAKGLVVAVVTSRYHHEVTSALREGAEQAFVDAGGDRGSLLSVEAPGSFELVSISSALARRHDVDAVVALGCIVTGETRHDRYIAEAVANALAMLAADLAKPVAFGVLTVASMKQARDRAGGRRGNKGVEAMEAAVLAAAAIRGASRLRASSAGGR